MLNGRDGILQKDVLIQTGDLADVEPEKVDKEDLDHTHLTDFRRCQKQAGQVTAKIEQGQIGQNAHQPVV